MAENKASVHGQWSSKMAFVMAATGSAVGLGNIWKFPYITGENGGGAFVLIYLACIAFVGVPLMMAEIMIGRRGRRNPVDTMRVLAIKENAHGNWHALGWMGVIAGWLILSYYSVIAGWATAYVFNSISGDFVGGDPQVVGKVFADLLSSPETLLFWHTLFMVATMWVVARGVQGGLEKAVRFLMPGLFLLLVLMIGYAATTGSFMQGVSFLFTPDFSKISGDSVLTALGHAFFTLSLGMGAIMVYGSYLPQNISIARVTFMIAGADTLVALMAGMAIFPLVFAHGLEPGSGPGLIFQTLPIAFGQMSGGVVFSFLFFVLLVFAAFSSSISLIEPAVAWLVENRNMGRVRASWLCGLSAWLLGFGTIFSFNLWKDFLLFDKNFFDLLDYLTANLMLPLGGILVAVFAGRVMHRNSSEQELELDKGVIYYFWRILVRWACPIAVTIVLIQASGLANKFVQYFIH